MPSHGSQSIETVDIDPEEGHDLLKMLVVPRPLAWVTTLRADGVVNLAPFASYTFVGFGPMMVGLAFARVRTNLALKKDTLRNIERSGEFVVHTVTEDMVDLAVGSAWTAPEGVSKAAQTGLTLVASDKVGVPRIAGCAAALECRTHEVRPVGDTHDLVIATVEAVHLDPVRFPGGEPDYSKFRPVGRLHGEFFATLGEIWHRPRRAKVAGS